MVRQICVACLLACAWLAASPGRPDWLGRLLLADEGPPPITLVLEMVAACLSQGSSISGSLAQTGRALSCDYGDDLVRVAGVLDSGGGWSMAWARVCTGPVYGQDMALLKGCLEPSWKTGTSAGTRIKAETARLDVEGRRGLQQASARLSVQILLPTGLCILPAFIVIGVIPCIASFAGFLT